MLVKLDVEMTGYGYRIDPDDFILVRATGAQPESVGDWPYTERLTASGKPTAWTDPAVVNDPDLRMLAYFVVPASLRRQSLAVSYNGKVSRPFEP